MAENIVAEFTKFLKARAVRWSETLQPSLGVRQLNFDGQLLRELLANNAIERFWDAIIAKLPKDACLIDTGGPLVLQMVSNGLYCDGYALIFGSEEWPRMEHWHDPIEPLELTFTRDDYLQQQDSPHNVTTTTEEP